MKPRDEYLEWCKQQAFKYLAEGDLQNAVTSMGSDLDKHPELDCNPYLLMLGIIRAQEGDERAVRDWIEGFR